MRRFVLDILAIVVASILVNWFLHTWDSVTQYPPRMSELALPTATRPPTSTPVPTTAPLPPTNGKYHFVYLPVRVWFNKEDALGYREALLDGTPTRPYISLDKSRTVRSVMLIKLKEEDALVMVKVEGTDIVGWIQ